MCLTTTPPHSQNGKGDDTDTMKIVRITKLIAAGKFSQSPEWDQIEADVQAAIRAVQWPPNSGSFTLHDQAGKARGEGSGVKPIKDACMKYLASREWTLNAPFPRVDEEEGGPGAFDAVLKVGHSSFALEWETGNISSSHRALNKVALGLIGKILVGGALILPTRKMYRYLTDRVGNYEELAPYFPLWSSLAVEEGVLAVIAIEHDAVSKTVPRIPKGTDGRALL